MDTNEWLTHQGEPYHFQRGRQHSNYPRASQPNTSQPNQKVSLPAWGISSHDYWNSILVDYLKRRKSGTSTNLAMGRL